MPRKNSIMQKRQWLEAYEQGKAEATIAKNARRDVRTVKKGIEDARRERVASIARADLVKEALSNHNKSLLSVIEEILLAIRLPASTQPIPWEKTTSSGPIRIEGGRAQHEDLVKPKVTGIVLDVEDKREWGLLQEHLKRESVWEALSRWKRALASHLEARITMKQRLARLLEEETGYEFVKEHASGSFLYSSSVDVLFQQLIQQLLGLAATSELAGNIIVDPDNGDVRYGQASILAHAPGAEQECKGHIVDALDKVQKSTEAEDVMSTYKMAEQLTSKAKLATDDIYMMGLVPGQCHICGRLGV